MRVLASYKPFIWLVLLITLCAGAAVRLDTQQPIDTNLLDLLPKSRPSPLMDAAIARARTIFLREMFLVVDAKSRTEAKQGAEAARAALVRAGFSVSSVPHGASKLFQLYRQYHYGLMTATDHERLERDPVPVFTSDLTAELANPIASLGISGTDSGGYLGRFLASLPSPYPQFRPDGPFMVRRYDGKNFFLLRVNLREASLGGHAATRAAGAIEAARVAVRQDCRECHLMATGAALFTATAQHEARSEIFWFTVSSVLFIVALILFVFRSLKPLALGALSVTTGVLAGAAAVVICYRSIQIFTLIGGTTLLGMAIDYAFLYFSEFWFGPGTASQTTKAVLPGLTMGLMTSVLAFAFLLLAGFPVLSQIAVFSIAGLLMSYLTVVMLFPLLLQGRPVTRVRPYLKWPQDLLERISRQSRWKYMVPLLLLAIALPGLLLLRSSDAVTELQNFPRRLIQSDQAINHLLGRSTVPGFFLIRGRNIQQALRREETLFEVANRVLPATTGLGLSRFLPSAAQQEANLAIWGKLYRKSHQLKQSFVHAGLPASFVDALAANWNHHARIPLDARTLLSAVPELGHFVIRVDGQIALIATLNTHDKTISTLQNIASRVPGVSFVDPIRQMTAAFRTIRRRATGLVLIGYLLISVLLIWRYGRRGALQVLWPPLLSLIVTLGVLGWLNQPVNIFVIVGLILVLGIGRDYSVFLREGSIDSYSTALGVTLAALATFCSFGMLTLSMIPALYAFGLTTLIGILVSYLAVPLAVGPGTRIQT